MAYQYTRADQAIWLTARLWSGFGNKNGNILYLLKEIEAYERSGAELLK